MGDDETRGSCRTLVLDRIDLSRARQRENSTSTMKKLKKVDGGCPRRRGVPSDDRRRSKEKEGKRRSDLGSPRRRARHSSADANSSRGHGARASQKKRTRVGAPSAPRAPRASRSALKIVSSRTRSRIARTHAIARDRGRRRGDVPSGTTTIHEEKKHKKTGSSLRSRVSSRFSHGWSAMLIARETPPPPCRAQA